jgi:hypothetical protein
MEKLIEESSGKKGERQKQKTGVQQEIEHGSDARLKRRAGKKTDLHGYGTKNILKCTTSKCPNFGTLFVHISTLCRILFFALLRELCGSLFKSFTNNTNGHKLKIVNVDVK